MTTANRQISVDARFALPMMLKPTSWRSEASLARIPPQSVGTQPVWGFDSIDLFADLRLCLPQLPLFLRPLPPDSQRPAQPVPRLSVLHSSTRALKAMCLKITLSYWGIKLRSWINPAWIVPIKKPMATRNLHVAAVFAHPQFFRFQKTIWTLPSLSMVTTGQ